jgi:hypothetical protein
VARRTTQATFEWAQLTYLFYPYFWGQKNNWLSIHQLEDIDPLFTKFLQAGSARVLVPVLPAYNDAVLHYLATGQIWNGGEAPTLDDPLFVSIADEVRAAGDSDAVDVGNPWEVRVPTELVYLQDDAALPVWA